MGGEGGRREVYVPSLCVGVSCPLSLISHFHVVSLT